MTYDSGWMSVFPSNPILRAFYRLDCEAVHVKRFSSWGSQPKVKGPLALPPEMSLLLSEVCGLFRVELEK